MPLPDDSTRDVPKQEPTVVLPEVGPQRDTAAGGQVTGSFASGQEPLLLSGEHSAHWPIIPGYEIQRELGRGGMGVVYEARQVALKRTVALKMIRTGSQAGPEERARFKTEAETIARLQHPNIVQIHEIGEVDGQAFYALEFVPGGSLARELAGAVVPPRQAAELVATLAQAMHVAHQAGVIHRDLKPANVLLAAQRVPKVTDFGLAKQMDDPAGPTQSGQILGTPSYMAPEQASGRPGEIGPATDIYALGAILYECLTGRPPFKGATMLETLEQVRSDEPVSPSQLQPRIPRDLVTICLKCLHKEPRRRYATAAALADDLGRFLRGEPVSAQPPSLLYLTGKLARRYRIPFSVATVVLIVLIGGTAVAFLGIDSERRAALDANHKLDDANRQLEDQLYDNRIAVAERELTLRQDIGLATDLLQLCPKRLRGWEWDYLMRLRDGAREPLIGHKAGLWTALFSPDGKQIATASIDGTAKIWDFATGKEKQILKGHTGNVNTVAFNKDGTLVATGSLDKSIRLWNPKDGKLVREFAKAHADSVQSVAFSPDGTLLASGSADKSVKLWDVKELKELKTLGSHKESVYNVAFNAAGTELASCGNDGVIKIWDVKGQKEIKSLMVELPRAVVKVEPKKEEPKKDKEVKKKDMGKKVEPKELREAFNAVAFTLDGKQILSVGSDKYLRFWNIADAKETKKIGPTSDWLLSVAVSKDGKNVATAGYGGSLRVYDIASGKEIYPGEGVAEKDKNKDRKYWVTHCAVFTPDGKAVVTGHEKSDRGVGNVVKLTTIMK